jgi:hypothetical protein
LGRRTGLTIQTLNGIELHGRNPSFGHTIVVVDALGISLEWLKTGVGDIFSGKPPVAQTAARAEALLAELEDKIARGEPDTFGQLARAVENLKLGIKQAQEFQETIQETKRLDADEAAIARASREYPVDAADETSSATV